MSDSDFLEKIKSWVHGGKGKQKGVESKSIYFPGTQLPLFELKDSLSPPINIEDMFLWAFQISEHCFFISQLSECSDTKIPEEAQQFTTLWLQMSHELKSENPHEALSGYVDLLMETIQFTKKVCRITKNQPDLFPSIWLALLKHMIEEEITILRLLPLPIPTTIGRKQISRITIQEELSAWLREETEKTILAAHSIDPINAKSNKITFDTLSLGMYLDSALKRKNLYPEKEIALADKGTKDLLTLIQNKKVFAHITPKMIEHEIRESMWRDRIRIPTLLHYLQGR